MSIYPQPRWTMRHATCCWNWHNEENLPMMSLSANILIFLSKIFIKFGVSWPHCRGFISSRDFCPLELMQAIYQYWYQWQYHSTHFCNQLFVENPLLNSGYLTITMSTFENCVWYKMGHYICFIFFGIFGVEYLGARDLSGSFLG